MKVPDSGMPEEIYWNSLFNIPMIVEWLDLISVAGPIVEFGCGYGTFTVPVAKETKEPVTAIDMESSMIQIAARRVEEAGLHNVHFVQRDMIEEGSGLGDNSAAMVLLFNILHFDGRRIMLEEACRILRPAGVIAVIHWRKDMETPRGPAVHLRPDHQSILASIAGLGVSLKGSGKILEPYHWGMQLIKGT